MIEVFKFSNGFDVVAPNTFFNRSFTGPRRGHEFKLYKSSFCTNLGKFSFSNRIVQDCNSLPQHMVYQVTLLIHLKIEWISINYLLCRGLSRIAAFFPLSVI